MSGRIEGASESSDRHPRWFLAQDVGYAVVWTRRQCEFHEMTEQRVRRVAEERGTLYDFTIVPRDNPVGRGTICVHTYVPTLLLRYAIGKAGMRDLTDASVSMSRGEDRSENK